MFGLGLLWQSWQINLALITFESKTSSLFAMIFLITIRIQQSEPMRDQTKQVERFLIFISATGVGLLSSTIRLAEFWAKPAKAEQKQKATSPRLQNQNKQQWRKKKKIRIFFYLFHFKFQQFSGSQFKSKSLDH